MELQEFVTIVKDMTIQHVYPGFEVRTLKLGLPKEALKSPARLFLSALQEEDPMVKLAALRWFQERPGDAKRYVKAIVDTLNDKDEWVRTEAIRTLGNIDGLGQDIAEKIALLINDPFLEVQKIAVSTCGKIRIASDFVVKSLQSAANAETIEIRWKAQKALRKLGIYDEKT